MSSVPFSLHPSVTHAACSTSAGLDSLVQRYKRVIRTDDCTHLANLYSTIVGVHNFKELYYTPAPFFLPPPSHIPPFHLWTHIWRKLAQNVFYLPLIYLTKCIYSFIFLLLAVRNSISFTKSIVFFICLSIYVCLLSIYLSIYLNI